MTAAISGGYVRTRDGRTVHRLSCRYAGNAEPWPWADGRDLDAAARDLEQAGVHPCGSCEPFTPAAVARLSGLSESIEIRRQPRGSVVHGTASGFNQHRRRKEPDCATCAANRKRPPAQCGTEAGRKRHRRLGEPVCRECQDFVNAENRRRYHRGNADA